MNEQAHYEIAIEWIEKNIQSLKDQTVRIQHDVWCPVWFGKVCNCQPDIFLQDGEELKKLNYPPNILK